MGERAEPEVLAEMLGAVAVVTLNRPKALNALNTNMVRELLSLNTEYSCPDCNVAAVVVRGAGGKAFCAGGDVKTAVLQARAGDTGSPMTFFRLEYVNNLAIAQLPRPYIALMDGIVMGGGVGVSYHGSFRVATERTVLAMPESGIGLFPDVGASFFLHRLPGRLGHYMGLTGARLTGAEVKDAGFATHFLPSSRLGELTDRLVGLGPRAGDHSAVDALLRDMEREQHERGQVQGQGQAVDNSGGEVWGGGGSGLLEWKLPLINAHFGKGSVAEVVASLEAAVTAGGQGQGQGEAARAFLADTLAAMRKGSPLSHAVTWEMLRRSAHLSLQQCLELEFALVGRFVEGRADFIEGVRALLIDKDGAPKWRYGSARDVPEDVVRAMFEGPSEEPPLFGGSPASPTSKM